MKRITLNAYNNKELVVLPGHSVQIWKAGEIQGSFTKHELEELSRTLLTRTTSYLQTCEHNGEPFDTVPTHMVHYTELRNKPLNETIISLRSMESQLLNKCTLETLHGKLYYNTNTTLFLLYTRLRVYVVIVLSCV